MPTVTMEIQDARHIATLSRALANAESVVERAAGMYGKSEHKELAASYFAAAYEERAFVYGMIAELQTKIGVDVIASNARVQSVRDLQSADKYRAEAEI